MSEEEPAAPTDDVAVLMRPGRDRELLAEWLESLGTCVPTVVDPDEPLPEYDLCLLDPAGLDRSLARLRERVRAVDPVFLPHLLVVDAESRSDLGDTNDIVDDVVTTPVDQAVLRRRIGTLLRTRRASARLAEREEQYRRLVELTPEALLVLREGTIVYANTAAADTFGVEDPTDLTGEPVDRLVADGERDRLTEILARIDCDGRLGEFRSLGMQATDGGKLDAEVAGVTVTFEEAPATQLLVRDVTEREQREQRLSLFGQAIETARQGITIADARQDDEPLIYANGAFERITGYSTAEVIGRNCRFLQGDGTDEETVAEIRSAIEAREPVSVELLNYRKDGTPFWNRLEIVPVSSPSGVVTHFLGLQRDVTERREREERLAVLDRVLRHNIRNRMNVIRSRAELLREADPGNAGTIIKAADDLTRITEQVRTFRSIVSAEERVLETVDLVALLARTVATIRESRPDADISFDCPEATGVEVDVHPTLPAALTELFELAFDNSGEDASISIRLTAGDDHATVEVYDRNGAIPRDGLRAIDSEIETELEHAQGLELWLIRWAVLYSEGQLTVTEDGDDGPPLRLRFPRL